MKLILLVASVIAVSIADSLDFPDRPDHGLNSDQTLNSDPLNHESTINTEVDQQFVEEREARKEKNMKGILKKELKPLKTLMDNSSSSLNSKLETLKGNVNSLSSNINSKHQYLNSNLNSKIQSLSNNTSNMNLNLNSKIQSLTNDTEAMNSNLNSKLQSLTNNMNNINSNVNAKFQSLTNNMNAKLQSLNLKLESIITNDLKEVSFSTIKGGTARATSMWSSGYSAIHGFAQPGRTWHGANGSKVPQSVWYEFPNVLRVVQFSFQSRTDCTTAHCPGSGAQSYEFWGSNASDCSSSSGRVVLIEDLSGTPFTSKNIPKVKYFKNPVNYRCYGFTIKATGNQYISMSNIRYWYN